MTTKQDWIDAIDEEDLKHAIEEYRRERQEDLKFDKYLKSTYQEDD